MNRRLLLTVVASAALVLTAACGQQTDERVPSSSDAAEVVPTEGPAEDVTASEVAAATPYVTLDCTSLQAMPVDAPPSQANFMWLQAHELSGPALTAAFERERIVVAPGGPLGEENHVRVAIRGQRETDRFLAALPRVLGMEPEPPKEDPE